jgi:hypothetical protein
MAKAQLREDFPVDHPPPWTADQLVAAIARLYRQLPSHSQRSTRPSLAYLALEAQIRLLARQHWALVTRPTSDARA